MGKNVLMVCYYYPPLTDVGCKRSVFFSKYFKDNGFSPYVLSVKNPDKSYCSLGNEKPPRDIPVFYSISLFNLSWFIGKLNGAVSRFLRMFGIDLKKNYFYEYLCIPDIFIGWIPQAILRGYRLIKKYDIDLIYVSVTPLSSALVGLCLKKLTGKKMVLDYRDPFGVDLRKYQPTFRQGWFRSRIDKKYADIVLRSCDIFTVTTKETENIYREQFPFLKNKIHTVYNGFDHRLINQLQDEDKFSKFTVIYTGEFYFQVEFEYFFDGLAILKKQGRICANDFQFLYYGGNRERIESALKKYDIEDLAIICARIPYIEVLKQIQRSHLQLLRLIQPMISTKLFEGMSLNTPFLATIPQGEVEEIVREFSPSSCVVTEKSAQKVAEAIVEAMNNYKTGNIRDNHVDEFLANYSRAKGASNMLEHFKGLLSQEN